MTCFYFDRAIGAFGRRLEQELTKAETGGKSKTQKAMRRAQVIRKWLGIQQFRNPGG